MNRKYSPDKTGRDAAVLSLIEVGLGAILHGFKIPLSGNFLSLNQGFLIARSSLRSGSRLQGIKVSNIAALLKSLSPAGKKLTPMLAIASQGVLFSLGTGVFGLNLIGLSVGMVLLALWSFIQPVLIYYVFYGKALLDMGDYFLKKFAEIFHFSPVNLVWVLLAIIMVKCILAIGIAFCAVYISDGTEDRYEKKLLKLSKTQRNRPSSVLNPIYGAARDLINPLFIVTFLLMAVFFVFVHSPNAMTVWALIRPFAVGYLIFLFIRLIDFERLFSRIENSRWTYFGQSCRAAYRILKNEKQS